ncbi:uncharacterized protein H6S33_007490 [Morchella sextelata]|uniref:uncharacterized protein n=1 Tax=Morchella sextelata TaxID=1174677 RepID=UPI001D03AFE9|nr:uncharacterized protein H6S33_007490 [Morchella sextelata]KAH0603831.1 hypothetical protein H6S33_007490 [Morchella sextelata]
MRTPAPPPSHPPDPLTSPASYRRCLLGIETLKASTASGCAESGGMAIHQRQEQCHLEARHIWIKFITGGITWGEALRADVELDKRRGPDPGVTVICRVRSVCLLRCVVTV